MGRGKFTRAQIWSINHVDCVSAISFTILHTYGDFFAELVITLDQEPRPEDGQGDTIFLEFLSISFKIAHAALSAADMRYETRSILDQHSWYHFGLMANSYSTTFSAQMLRDTSLNSRMKDVIFIDPVSFTFQK
ncbi:hypothetical protein WAI453_009183 [Rhynchosporium graminicola]